MKLLEICLHKSKLLPFKWTFIGCLQELSHCVCRMILVTTATNREDLVGASTLHWPCYDSVM